MGRKGFDPPHGGLLACVFLQNDNLLVNIASGHPSGQLQRGASHAPFRI
jgi:hypothetical protein